MYFGMVRRKIGRVFAAISAGDVEPMLGSLAPSFRYLFHGDHSLGGVRTTQESMSLWWKRVFGLLPGMQFSVCDVLVEGFPWRTRVAVRLDICGVLADGSPYVNVAFQFMQLRWGKVVSIETLEDLDRLRRALDVSTSCGNAEAAAPPIVDADARSAF